MVLKVFVVNSIRKCLKTSTYKLISKGFALVRKVFIVNSICANLLIVLEFADHVHVLKAIVNRLCQCTTSTMARKTAQALNALLHGISSSDFDSQDKEGFQDVLLDYFSDSARATRMSDSSDEDYDSDTPLELEKR